ncbi:MAG TPA: hypothetical protein VFD49_03040 [Candidatus Dormibacteraeota bacterium]|nr:hypothetical protein [Candidatus Dormibacteraeota bacterium]
MHEFAPRLHPLATPARAEEMEGTIQLGRDQVKLIERYHQAVTAARFAQQEAAELRSQILALGSGPSWVGAYRGRRLVEVREICRTTPSVEALREGYPEVYEAVLREQRYPTVRVLLNGEREAS